MRKHSITNSLIWKMLERFGVQGIQFVLQIVLARVLAPEHYGTLSLMVIFSTLATVFIQTGFNTALIQNKDVTEEDYSSVFWVTIVLAGVIYLGAFFAAPLLASFYNMPEIVWPFRALMLMLFPGSLNSIQLAKAGREMDFRKVFTGNIGGVLVSGAVGIGLAYAGAGLWSLVAQSVLNVLIATIVMLFTIKWKLRFVCNFQRVRVLFSYGWKLLVSGMIDTLYQDLSALVIGKKYTTETLAYYNRGKQFPQFLITAINSTVQSVMLPAMSERQNDREQVKNLMRTAVALSAYLVFPVMAGMAAVAEPMVRLLLTDKWLFCVPYLQIFCITQAFYPVHSSNLQAINAMGRSDIFLKLEIIKKSYGIVALAIAVFCFDSPMAIALSGVITTGISCFVNAAPNKKLIGYSYFEQMRDIFPSLVLSLAMFGVVSAVGRLQIGNLALLLLQILVGLTIYIILSHIFKIKPYVLASGMLKNLRQKRKG